MKTSSFKLITAGIAGVMISPAFALEAPADNAPPPPSVERTQPANASPPPAANLPRFKLTTPPAAEAKPEARVNEETAFLGVVSGEVPECLADHVGLEHGQGIIVRSLVPGGPADKAGIALNDVITAVGDEPVNTPSDISNRIAAHKPGETVSISIIHKGAAGKTEVVLGTRPQGLSSGEPQTLDSTDLDGLPKELADRIKRHLGQLDMKLGEDAGAMPPRLEEAMREMQKRMKDAMDQGGLAVPEDDPALKGNAHAESSATFKMKDNDGSVEVRSADGSKEVTIRDHEDNIVWSGPWNTADDKSAAPADVQRRMEGLNLDGSFKGNGLRFRMRAGGNGK